MRRLTQAELLVKWGDPTKKATARKIRQLRLPMEDSTVSRMMATSAREEIAAKFVDAWWQTCRATGEWPDECQSYNLRKIAGTNKWSLHAWALAWDVFDSKGIHGDPLTGRTIPSPAWFNGMQAKGFFAGQNFKKPDRHHLEYPW
jgi:hypothetical protein